MLVTRTYQNQHSTRKGLKMDWYDRACQELEEQYEAGEISLKEFNREIRELNAEFREYAADEAQRHYDDIIGGW